MTANNQYFERKMLIQAEKTNTILESDDHQPTKLLREINTFLDASAATVKNQIDINNTLTSLLGENADMETELILLNKKLKYQNTRPPGVGSDDIWLPTQLLMEMVRLQEESNDSVAETGSGTELGILYDISKNTGAAIPLLQEISDNTDALKQGLIDNSKNLYDPGGAQPWLETVNTTLNTNLPFLSTLNSQIDLLFKRDGSFNKVKISQRRGAVAIDWLNGTPATSAEGEWVLHAITYPPKKFTLFVKLSAAPTSTDYVNFYSSFTGVGGEYYLHDRYTYDDFNPPIVEGDVLGSGTRTWDKVPAPASWVLSKTYDWIGQYMKIEYKSPIPSGILIQACFARGI